MYDTPRINKKENVPYKKVCIFTPMCMCLCVIGCFCFQAQP